MRRSIQQTFSELRAAGKVGLMPFIPAGFPDLATTGALLPALEHAGASLIEVGIPFSDPIADGPVIQEAFTLALSRGLRVAEVFDAVAAARASVSIPLVAMVSYSVVFRFGVDDFLSRARTAGFDGLILPDLPPPEAQAVCQRVRAAGLDTILLVAPTTPPARRAQIVNLCSGFVYYLSVSGITGERDRLPIDLEENLRQLRSLTELPICVGFGIHRGQQVKDLAGLADGAIVGTAIVRRMSEAGEAGPAATAHAAAEYCRSLLGAT